VQHSMKYKNGCCGKNTSWASWRTVRLEHCSFTASQALTTPFLIVVQGKLQWIERSFWECQTLPLKQWRFSSSPLIGFQETWNQNCLEMSFYRWASYCNEQALITNIHGAISCSQVYATVHALHHKSTNVDCMR